MGSWGEFRASGLRSTVEGLGFQRSGLRAWQTLGFRASGLGRAFRPIRVWCSPNPTLKVEGLGV